MAHFSSHVTSDTLHLRQPPSTRRTTPRPSPTPTNHLSPTYASSPLPHATLNFWLRAHSRLHDAHSRQHAPTHVSTKHPLTSARHPLTSARHPLTSARHPLTSAPQNSSYDCCGSSRLPHAHSRHTTPTHVCSTPTHLCSTPTHVCTIHPHTPAQHPHTSTQLPHTSAPQNPLLRLLWLL